MSPNNQTVNMTEVVEQAKVLHQDYFSKQMNEILEYNKDIPKIFADAILMAASYGETSSRINLKYPLSVYITEFTYKPLNVKYIGKITIDSPISEGKKNVIGYEYEISFEL
jgi:hypothetical protein